MLQRILLRRSVHHAGGILSTAASASPSSLPAAATSTICTRAPAGKCSSLRTRRTYATTPSNISSTSPKNSPTKKLTLPPSRSPHTSAKLSALHARLHLSPNLPLETVARCLIDPTAEPNPKFNNSTLSNLGNNLLGYYVTEHLLVTWPRLPLDVLKAAMYAYISPQALFQLGREWGVEAAFEPTMECDAGLLQFKRLAPGAAWGPERFFQTGDEDDLVPSTLKNSTTSTTDEANATTNPPEPEGIPLSHATANFVKALFASIHLHESPSAAHHFFKRHILSRHLDISKLFHFEQPTRHLSRLCAREGFESPVARLLSETGRGSRAPVFVVGAFSGEERLGEGYGASQDEARIKAAVGALKGWYLYSPAIGGDVPSRMEMDDEEGEDGVVGGTAGRKGGEVAEEKFRPAFVDVGEVVI